MSYALLQEGCWPPQKQKISCQALASFIPKVAVAVKNSTFPPVINGDDLDQISMKPRRVRLSRHYYDLWCLIRKGIAAQAVADPELFSRVARHRQIFFKVRWVNYDTLRKGTLRLLPSLEQITDWRRDYESMRKEMFFDEPPSFDEVLAVIRQFEEAFNRL